MYQLEYRINGVNAVVRNNDPKVLRNMIKCLSKDDEWTLKNEGGCVLDSSHERNFGCYRGMPKKGD